MASIVFFRPVSVVRDVRLETQAKMKKKLVRIALIYRVSLRELDFKKKVCCAQGKIFVKIRNQINNK